MKPELVENVALSPEDRFILIRLNPGVEGPAGILLNPPDLAPAVAASVLCQAAVALLALTLSPILTPGGGRQARAGSTTADTPAGGNGASKNGSASESSSKS